jgi:hypothetical protein
MLALPKGSCDSSNCTVIEKPFESDTVRTSDIESAWAILAPKVSKSTAPNDEHVDFINTFLRIRIGLPPPC